MGKFGIFLLIHLPSKVIVRMYIDEEMSYKVYILHVIRNITFWKTLNLYILNKTMRSCMY